MLFSCLGSSYECALIGMSRKSARIATSLMCFRVSLSSSGCSGRNSICVYLCIGESFEATFKVNQCPAGRFTLIGGGDDDESMSVSMFRSNTN